MNTVENIEARETISAKERRRKEKRERIEKRVGNVGIRKGVEKRE